MGGMDPTRCAAAMSAPAKVGACCSASLDKGEWGAGRGVDACCLSGSTDVRVDGPASRNLNPNEVAETTTGAALLMLSVSDPLAGVKGAMLDTDGLCRACPVLSARFEGLTSRAGGGSGVYVVQGDAMVHALYPGLDRYALANPESWEARLHDLYMLFHILPMSFLDIA
jgi:hypothetical protein